MKSLQVRICRFFATLGPIGYLPMPGTFGTLSAIPLLFGLRVLSAQFGLFQENIILVGLFFPVWWIVNQALRSFIKKDPSEIIIDEVLGYFVTMIYLPVQPLTILLAFVWFRFFDIVKPLGIDYVERVSGAWGIVLDDVVAGIWAHICLKITLQLLL